MAEPRHTDIYKRVFRDAIQDFFDTQLHVGDAHRYQPRDAATFADGSIILTRYTCDAADDDERLA